MENGEWDIENGEFKEISIILKKIWNRFPERLDPAVSAAPFLLGLDGGLIVVNEWNDIV